MLLTVCFVLSEIIAAARFSPVVFVSLGVAAAVPGIVSAPESVHLLLWGTGLIALNSLLRSGPAVAVSIRVLDSRLARGPLAPRLGRTIEN